MASDAPERKLVLCGIAVKTFKSYITSERHVRCVRVVNQRYLIVKTSYTRSENRCFQLAGHYDFRGDELNSRGPLLRLHGGISPLEREPV